MLARNIGTKLFYNQKRYNSTIPTILSYMKDKGTEIPFAKKFLAEDEYERYTLYTRVKKGDYEWLKTYVNENPLQQEEKTTITKYIQGLKEQPYSVPNLGIGYITIKFGLSSIYYSVTGVLIPLLGAPLDQTLQHQIKNTIHNAITEYHLQVLSNMTTTGSIILDCVGLYSIWYGVKIITNELRSPYYHYDEMLRICNNQKHN